jgi:TPR repeat protein
MWEQEPDIDEIRRLHGMLSSDAVRALEGLKELAERGSVMSMLYLADAYRTGTGTDIDPSQSQEWFGRAAAAGSLLASYELGGIHWDAKDYENAHREFSGGAAKKYAPSMNLLAMIYVNGLGVPVDVQRARELLEGAVAQGHVFAKRNLGCLLMKGHMGVWQIPRGFLLFLSAFMDVLILVPRDRKSERLR